MFKQTVIILLIGLLNFSIANGKSETINSLELIESQKNELLIDQQYSKFINSLRPKVHQSSAKTLGGTSVINGHIQDASALNLVNHDITLYEIIAGDFSFVASEITNVDGNYSFANLQAGTYLVLSGSNTDDYLNYRWQSDSPSLCTSPYNCIDTLSSHIVLADATTINNIDFTVALGGQIHGLISDAMSMNGVATLEVRLVNTDLSLYGYSLFTIIDPLTGVYSIKGIPDGDYRVYLDPLTLFLAEDNLHIPQIFGGPECNDCNRLIRDGTGTVLSIVTATVINNIDFSVRVGASISGFLVDNNTFSPLAGIGLILVFNDANSSLSIGAVPGLNIDPTEDGSYLIGGLLPGSYYIQGGDLGRDFYQRELYNNKSCYYSGCDRGTGDVVLLGALENRAGINFLLDKGGKISGMVTDAITGLPIVQDPNDFNLQVEFYNSSEVVVGSGFIKEDGSYISARALPAGIYSARTGSMFQGDLTQPYVNQKYSGIECAGLACDLSATNIVVTNDTVTSGIDFTLSIGNSFSGTVTDLASNAPIGGVHVLVYKEMSPGVVKFANWATSSDGGSGEPPIGTFEVNGLPDGTYYARTGYGSDLPFFVSSFHNIGGVAPIGWIDMLYDGMPCLADCDVTLGTPIILPVVTNKALVGGTTVNFSLTQGAVITGHVKDFIDNASLSEITINVFNDQGTFMGSSITDSDGKYITRGLPDGTYYLTTTSFGVLLDVKYGNEFCTPSECNPLEAIPISVTGSQQTDNKDFVLKTAYMHMFSNDFEQ
jgi:hypothetical protein